MRRGILAAIASAGLASACGALLGLEDAVLDDGQTALDAGDASTDAIGSEPKPDGALVDAGSDAAATPRCDLTKPFGAPVLVPGLDVPDSDVSAGSMTADERETVFVATSGTDDRIGLLYRASRASPDVPFEITGTAGIKAAGISEGAPTISPDGLSLLYSLTDLDAGAASRSYVRYTRGAPFTDFVQDEDSLLFPAPSPYETPFLTKDELYFAFVRPGDLKRDLSLLVRGDGGYVAPDGLAFSLDVNAPTDEAYPVLTGDGLTLYFASDRRFGGGGTLAMDIYVAHRATPTGVFDDPVSVPEVNEAPSGKPAFQLPRWVSPDGCRLYFTAGDGLAYAPYVAEKPP